MHVAVIIKEEVMNWEGGAHHRSWGSEADLVFMYEVLNKN